MKRWLFALALLTGIVAISNGQIVGTLPFTFQNNTVADATQVNANFNAIVSGVNTSAMPLAAAASYMGAISTGSANAQVVSTLTPLGFTLAQGRMVSFVAGFTNTASMTLNVGGTGAVVVYKAGTAAAVLATGGEVVFGTTVTAVYNGSSWQLTTNSAALMPTGTMVDFAGTVVPTGWLQADGSCYTQVGYPDLFAVLGTTWGSCPAGQFAVPDTRGRTTAMLDLGADRLNATSGCATALAVACGAQVLTLGQTHLPNVNFAVSNPTISDTRQFVINSTQNIVAITSLGTTTAGGGTNYTALTLSAPGAGVNLIMDVPAGLVGGTITAGGGIVNSGGGNTAFATYGPVLIVRKIIKF